MPLVLNAATSGATTIQASDNVTATITLPSTTGTLVTSAVTSAVAGNGVAVSGATGAVTFSAACPTFNTVGSYCFVNIFNSSALSSGSNYAAGNGSNQVQSASAGGTPTWTNNLSGTWKWMAGPSGANFTDNNGVACRVS